MKTRSSALNRHASPSPTEEAIGKARVIAVGEAIRALLKDLTPEDRAALQRNLADALAEKPVTPRAGPVLDKVVQLFQRERDRRAEWNVAEVKAALVEEGVDASSRALYNALGYLARKRRIKQVGYGKYYILDYGIGIETSGDLFSSVRGARTDK